MNIVSERFREALCSQSPRVCGAIANFNQWVLERDTQKSEFICGLASIGTAGWIGWPLGQVHVGKSDFYDFLTRYFSMYSVFILFFTLGMVQWLALIYSKQPGWKLPGNLDVLKVRYGVCFVSAVLWYTIFNLYRREQLGGLIGILSFCFMFDSGWNYICLKHGKKAYKRRLLSLLEHDLKNSMEK